VSQEEVTLLLLQQFFEMDSDRCSKILRNDVGERKLHRVSTGSRKARADNKLRAVPTTAFWEGLMSRRRLAAPYGKPGKSPRSGSKSRFIRKIPG
jgi:hypothetical protein